ncbi:hypothetical protein ABT187_28630 [Streptomyces sp. NPDC001817]|uniref:hypothetical protein n=1 Tax=Streptomyces sp. NPDC001817 TaxID=3154398 RepID=UPI00333140A8
MSDALHPELFGDWCEYGDVRIRAYDLERFKPTEDERDSDSPKGYAFFRFKVTVENMSDEGVQVDVGADVRVGRDGLSALPLFRATSRILGVNVYPLRRVTGIYAFRCRAAEADLVDAQLDIRVDGNRLEGADWTGQLTPVKTKAGKKAGKKKAKPNDSYLGSAVIDGVHAWLQEQVQAIAEENPEAARELGIGDPYKTAGRGFHWRLADVNSLTVGELAAALSVPEETAERIVSVRELLGGSFADVDQVLQYTSLSEEEREAIYERAVVLPPEDSP